jgi:hypothetical protein
MSTQATIKYLARLELYKTEKPYMTTFEIPAEIGSSTNHQYTSNQVTIRDARPNQASFTLETHGFEYREWPLKFRNVEFEDEAFIKSAYDADILQHMKDAYPRAKDIFILSHLVG